MFVVYFMFHRVSYMQQLMYSVHFIADIIYNVTTLLNNLAALNPDAEPFPPVLENTFHL